MTWHTSPAATELETVVLNWIRQMIRLPESFTGVVYDTASIGIVHALAAAREAAGPEIRTRGLSGRRDLPVFRVYASDQAHSSIERAAIVLGLGEMNVVRVPSDANFRLDVIALSDAIRADIVAGFRPLAVVATVGTTSTASIDPVRAIAEVCRANKMWLHVDAAYGGALAVLPERHEVMGGAELADSVIVNPHKWLFVPLDFSALYVRDPALLRSVFALVPEYLRGDSSSDAPTHDDSNVQPSAAIDYMDYGIQLGRRFRALKAWMVFRAFGRNGIESRIREHCRLAELLATWIDASKNFELAAPVTMAVVCFRYEDETLDAEALDRINEAIVQRVNTSGEAYMTHTRLGGRTVLRVGIGNVRTTEVHVAKVWQCIQRAAKLDGSMSVAIPANPNSPSRESPNS